MTRRLVLSPQRFLRMGYGQALPSDFSMSTLRTVLSQAQDQVSRYCAVPKMPQAYDWRGGTMTNEKQQWKVSNPLAYGEGVRRVYLNSYPIKAITDFHLDLGLTFSIQVPNDQLYLNAQESYFEIVALSPTVVGYYPLAVNLGLYQPIARVSYTYGWQFDITDDVLESETPTVFSGAYGNWIASPAPVIYFDGVAVNPADYTLNGDDGQVTFTDTTKPSPGVVVSADYSYAVPDEIVQAVGITTAHLIGMSRIAARGMTGLQSIKVAEVALTSMYPSKTAVRNGVILPEMAALLADGYTFGSIAA